MKLVSLFIALCFTMNVFASTGSLQAFESVLDDYQYAMSVEWDQADAKFQETKTKEFFNQTQSLITAGALTQQDIITVVEKRIKDKAVLDALKLRLTLAGEMNSTEELNKFLKESSNDFYSRGASWNGVILVSAAVVVTAAMALGFAMWYSATHGCKEYAQTCDVFGCRNNYDVCVDYGYTGPHL